MPCRAHRRGRATLAVLTTAVVALAIPLGVPATTAAASPRDSALLGALWQEVFRLPLAENPFNGADPCLQLTDPQTGHTVLAPFAPPTAETTCTAVKGTKLLVTAWSTECSDVEGPPFHGEGEAELRECALLADEGIDTVVVTMDGHPVQVKETETALMDVRLGADNIFEVPTGTPIQSVAHGWVALVPLSPGVHVLTIHTAGTYVWPPGPHDETTTTTIVVTR